MNKLDYSDFYRDLKISGLKKWEPQLKAAIEKEISKPDGNLPGWIESYAELPEIEAEFRSFDQPEVTLGKASEITEDLVSKLKQSLFKLSPWRKGPYNIFGIQIDSEWRSDLKWNRVLPHLSCLKGRKILDVGCGNGYHMFRMIGEGAKFVLGADPSLLFVMQFLACKKFAPELPVHLLPIGVEALPRMQCFDTVFSMGVFYHRKSPFDFLRNLKDLLKNGGELVLETLIIEGDANTVLIPKDRYARMRNVWFIPSTQAMINWLSKAGFKNVRVVDVSRTTAKEQRVTEWMPGGESLDYSLDKNDQSLTIEGYPAPTRAMFIAQK